eukprot:scaffold5021_cov123-Isochrysis_galbana.AAC.15
MSWHQLCTMDVPRGKSPRRPSLLNMPSVKPHEATADWPSEENSQCATVAARLYPERRTPLESSWRKRTESTTS